jgi:fluoride exporter
MRQLIQSSMTFLTPYIAIGFAASLGAIARFVLSSACGRFFGTGFPVGTFIINISASLALGWFMTVTDHRIIVSDTVKIAVAIGFIGTYSTFSTFAYETDSLLESGSGIKALVNVLGSLVGGIVAVRLGAALGRV